MTLLWLIAWWSAALPPALVGPGWNPWGIALVACATIDAITALLLARRELTRPAVKRVWKPGIGWTYPGPEISKEV